MKTNFACASNGEVIAPIKARAIDVCKQFQYDKRLQSVALLCDVSFSSVDEPWDLFRHTITWGSDRTPLQYQELEEEESETVLKTPYSRLLWSRV